jgi:dTDP-4-amino-4,6-dideoxygalactose transaminase/nucleoside-diphosphate-sugar epimerase
VSGLGDADPSWVVVGGGFLGLAVAGRLYDAGIPVRVLDRRPLPQDCPVPARILDVTLADDLALPAGRIVLALGDPDPVQSWPWRVVYGNVFPTARLAAHLAGRDVVLASSIEALGAAPGPLRDDSVPALPVDDRRVDDWAARACGLALEPCPPSRAAALCREVVASDPTGRWVYGIAKRVQERIVERAGCRRLEVRRFPNLFGPGQERVIGHLARAAAAGRTLHVQDATRCFLAVDDAARAIVDLRIDGVCNVGGAAVPLPELADRIAAHLDTDARVELHPAPATDSCGDVRADAFARAGGTCSPFEDTLAEYLDLVLKASEPIVRPPLPVVLPPAPCRPDVVERRVSEALHRGALKAGGRWSGELAEHLRAVTGAGASHAVELTTSGTSALRLAVLAVAGRAGDRPCAVLPSFTFPATAEVLRQLGYTLRFADVDPATWTLDPASVREGLAPGDVGVVVTVDTFGVPSDYRALAAVCRAAGVPLVADSAAALGSVAAGRPVGTQVDAHAFSLSFAKTVSSGGAGGVVVVGAQQWEDHVIAAAEGWTRSEGLPELLAIPALDLLEHFDELAAIRRARAARYRALLRGNDGFTTQHVRPGDDPVLVHFVVRVEDLARDDLAATLDDMGVGTRPYFRALHRTGPLPVTDRLDRQVLALPMSSELAPRQVDVVVGALEAAVRLLEA